MITRTRTMFLKVTSTSTCNEPLSAFNLHSEHIRLDDEDIGPRRHISLRARRVCRVLPARSALRTAPEGSYPICLLGNEPSSSSTRPPPRRYAPSLPGFTLFAIEGYCRESPLLRNGRKAPRAMALPAIWNGIPDSLLIPTKDSEMREVISRSFRGLRSEPQPLDTGNWAFRGVFERALNTPPTLAGRQPDRPPASRRLCMLR